MNSDLQRFLRLLSIIWSHFSEVIQLVMIVFPACFLENAILVTILHPRPSSMIPVGECQVDHAGQGRRMLGAKYCLPYLHHLRLRLFASVHRLLML